MTTTKKRVQTQQRKDMAEKEATLRIQQREVRVDSGPLPLLLKSDEIAEVNDVDERQENVAIVPEDTRKERASIQNEVEEVVADAGDAPVELNLVNQAPEDAPTKPRNTSDAPKTIEQKDVGVATEAEDASTGRNTVDGTAEHSPTKSPATSEQPRMIEEESEEVAAEAKEPDSVSQAAADEKAQVAPFYLGDLTQSALEKQQLALNAECSTTVLYRLAGIELLQLKARFRELRRRDFCAYTEAAGIKPWFRKRAMRIASHFKTEEACRNIPLLDALDEAKKQPTTNSQAVPAQDGQPINLPATRTGDTLSDESEGNADASAAAKAKKKQPLASASVDSQKMVPTTQRWRIAKTEDCDLTPTEIDTGTRLLEVVNGDRERAGHVLDVLTETVAGVSE